LLDRDRERREEGEAVGEDGFLFLGNSIHDASYLYEVVGVVDTHNCPRLHHLLSSQVYTPLNGRAGCLKTIAGRELATDAAN